MRDIFICEIIGQAAEKMGSAIMRGLSGPDLSDEDLAEVAARQNAIDNQASAYSRGGA